MVTKLIIKSPKYECEKCCIKTDNKKDYEKHILTAKHLKPHKGDILSGKSDNKIILECNKCKKIYKSRNGLWKHNKICNYNVTDVINENNDFISIFIKENAEFKNLILDIVKNNSDLQKQNQELQKQVLDVCQNIQPSTINNTNNNSHNKTFNLQFFLNEQCKDAMNIMDFVNTFQLQFSDLERIGEVGYVEGISNLIIDKLNSMDIYKRPIHCSDAKREIMHIKDNGVWEKDNENNDKLRLAIKHITKKNIDMIGSWTEKYPGVRDSDHRLNDKYNEIIMEAMGGKNNKTMKEGEAKIIKKISKMVLIDKNM
jgi:hypothetical protein